MLKTKEKNNDSINEDILIYILASWLLICMDCHNVRKNMYLIKESVAILEQQYRGFMFMNQGSKLLHSEIIDFYNFHLT